MSNVYNNAFSTNNFNTGNYLISAVPVGMVPDQAMSIPMLAPQQTSSVSEVPASAEAAEAEIASAEVQEESVYSVRSDDSSAYSNYNRYGHSRYHLCRCHHHNMSHNH